MIPDDHLILSAAPDHRHNAVRLFQHIRVCFALVLQFEPKSCYTVRQAEDIPLPSYILDNDPCQTIILACHKRSSFTFAPSG